MVLVNGFIQTKQLTKESGLVQKNMDKELKLGRMATFTKANLKIVNGAAQEF